MGILTNRFQGKAQGQGKGRHSAEVPQTDATGTCEQSRISARRHGTRRLGHGILARHLRIPDSMRMAASALLSFTMAANATISPALAAESGGLLGDGTASTADLVDRYGDLFDGGTDDTGDGDAADGLSVTGDDERDKVVHVYFYDDAPEDADGNPVTVTGEMGKLDLEQGSTKKKKLPKNEFAAEGYDFVCWVTEPVTVTDGETGETTEIESIEVPDAQELRGLDWEEEIEYTVVGNDGEEETKTEKIPHTLADYVIDGIVSLHAKWEPKPVEEKAEGEQAGDSEQQQEEQKQQNDKKDTPTVDDKSSDKQDNDETTVASDKKADDTGDSRPADEKADDKADEQNGEQKSGDATNKQDELDTNADEDGKSNDSADDGTGGPVTSYVQQNGLEGASASGVALRDEKTLKGALTSEQGMVDEVAGRVAKSLLSAGNLRGQGDRGDGDGEGGDGDGEEQTGRSGDGTNIEGISVRWQTPDTIDDEDAANLYLKPLDDTPQTMVARISYALSGEHDYEAGDINITIPASIWTYRDGTDGGATVIPYPQDPKTMQEFNWRQVGDTYIITNTRHMSAATKGYIDIQIENVIPHKVVDHTDSEPFSATIDVLTHRNNVLSLSSNSIKAQIDTEAQVVNASKRASSVSWVSADQIPAEQRVAGETEYVVVSWYFTGTKTGNTEYTIGLADEIADEYDGFIIGSTDDPLTWEDDSAFTGWAAGGSLPSRTIKSAYPGSQFTQGQRYVFHNSVTYTLTETDPAIGDDPKLVTEETGTATAVLYEQPPTFVEPYGHFMLNKIGNDAEDGGWKTHYYSQLNSTGYPDTSIHNSDRYAGVYGSALFDLKEGEDVEFAYTYETIGYILPWTCEGDHRVAANYGRRDVTMVTYDTDENQSGGSLYLSDGTTLALGSDYDYKAVEFPVKPHINKIAASNLNPDGTFVNPHVSSGTYNTQTDSDDSNIPTITLEAKVGGNWVKLADIDWSSGSCVITPETGVSVDASKNRVILPANATNTRTTVSSRNAAIWYYVRPIYELHPTTDVTDIVDDLFADSLLPSIGVYNTARMFAYDDGDNKLVEIAKNAVDHMRGYNADVWVRPSKTARQKSVDYDWRNVTIHYTTTVEENTFISAIDTYNEAVGSGRIIPETSGTFYDLLPKGMTPILSSVKLRDDDIIEDVYTIEDWRGSGRTLLVVKARLTPKLQRYYLDNAALPVAFSSSVPNDYYLQDVPTLEFDATYPFDAIKDYGSNPHNVVTFESDKDEIGTIANYGGEPNNPVPGLGNVYTRLQTTFENAEEKSLVAGLGGSRADPSFVYAGASSNISILSAARTSLNKEVQVNNDGKWSNGTYDDHRNVMEGGQYSYKLRMMSDTDTVSKELVLFDALEEFEAGQGNDPNDVNAPSWQGRLRSVDVSQLIEQGCAPVVYYSTTAGLQFADETNPQVANATNTNVADTSIWTPAASYSGDLSAVRAIAVDARKRGDGTDFELDPTESAVVIVNMLAPSGQAARDIIAEDGHAYNNVYLTCVSLVYDELGQLDAEHTKDPNFIRKDYTKVGLVENNMIVRKVWNDGNDRDGLRPASVTVHLYANGVDSGDSVTLSEDGGTVPWENVFEHLPYTDANGQKIHYTLVEDSVSGYTVGVSQGSDGQTTVTNRHDPEKITVSGTKTWVGDTLSIRPTTIKVFLVANGQTIATKTVMANADGDWRYTFEDVWANEDGQPIDYQVIEQVPDVYLMSTDGYDITNTYHPYGDLSVSKSVVGATGEFANRRFDMTIHLQDGEGENLTDEYEWDNGEEGASRREGTIISGGTISLGDDETITIHELPQGASYSVVEEDADGYTVTESAGLEGTIVANIKKQASLTNTYHATGSASITVDKTLTGRDSMNPYQFQFQLLDDTTNPPTTVATSSNDANGHATFRNLDYTEEDAGQTYTYRIVEKDRGRAGYLYDVSEYLVHVSIADNGNGTLAVTPTYEKIKESCKEGTGNDIHFAVNSTTGKVEGDEVDPPEALATSSVPSFENEYHASGSVRLRAWKRVEGGDVSEYSDNEHPFEFELVDEQGNVLQTKACDEMGAVYFDAIDYDEGDAGQKFRYVIREKAGNDERVIYDDSVFAYEVSVVDNGDGTLTCSTGNVNAEPVYERQEWNDASDAEHRSNAWGWKHNLSGFQPSMYPLIIYNPDYDYSAWPADWRNDLNNNTQDAYVAYFADFLSQSTGISIEPSDITSLGSVVFNTKMVPCVLTSEARARLNDALAPELNALTSNALGFWIVTEENFNSVTSDAAFTSSARHFTLKPTSLTGYTVTSDEEGEPLLFVNELQPGGLSISKSTTGTVPIEHENDEFTFKVQLTGENLPESIEYTLTQTPEAEPNPSNGGGTGTGVGLFDGTPLYDLTNVVKALWEVKKAYAGVNWSQDGLIDSTVEWRLEDGILYIQPLSGESGILKYNANDPGASRPPWNSSAGQIRQVEIPDGCVIQLCGDCHALFSGCSSLTAGDFNQFDTSQVTDLGSAFQGCSRLNPDVSNWNVSNVRSMNAMFSGCSSANPNVANWNTSSLTSTYNMFWNCSGADFNPDVSHWDTSHLTDATAMFYGCSGDAFNPDVSNWDTSSLTVMQEMFRNCSGSSFAPNVSQWNTSNVRNMRAVFANTRSASLDVSGWNTNQVTDMYMLFYYCPNLTSLDLSNWDTRNVTNMNYMFGNTTNLSAIKLGAYNALYGRANNANSLLTPPAETTSGQWVQLQNISNSKSSSELCAMGTTGILQSDEQGWWVWERNGTYIRYDANGGIGSAMPMQFVAFGDTGAISSSTYVMPYNECSSWNTISNGTGTSYEIASEYVSQANTIENLVLYAQWTPQKQSASLADGSFMITLPAGHTATIDNLPAGVSYSISEETQDGWVLVEQSGTGGEIVPLETAEASFTNQYVPNVTTAQIFGTKTLDNHGADGTDPEDGEQFTFELVERGTNGVGTEETVIQTVHNGAGGAIMFDPIVYEHDSQHCSSQNPLNNYPVEYGRHYYIVREVRGADTTMTYDTRAYGVSVIVTETEQGKLSSQVSYLGVVSGPEFDWQAEPAGASGNNIAFANRHNPGNLTLTKNITGPAGSDTQQEEFTFKIRLTNPNGEPLNNVSMRRLDGNGNPISVSSNPSDSQDTPDSGIGIGYNICDTDVGSILKQLCKTTEEIFGVQKAYADIVEWSPYYGYGLGGSHYSTVEYRIDDDGVVWFRAAANAAEPHVGELFLADAGDTMDNSGILSTRYNNVITGVRVVEGDTIKLIGYAKRAFNGYNTTFRYCTSFDSTAIDVSEATDLRYILHKYTGLTGVLDLTGWDVSNVTDLGWAFVSCGSYSNDFNILCNNWDTSSVNNMHAMFNACASAAFNPDVSNWNVSNVTDMSNMFSGCRGAAFNPDVSNWNVSNVTNMSSMFSNCSGAAFNPDVSNWNVSNVTDMRAMFQYARVTALDLSSWNTSNVTRMDNMFNGASLLSSVTLGQYNALAGNGTYAQLPTPTSQYYTGKWVNIDYPEANDALTSEELAHLGDDNGHFLLPEQQGTWVWETYTDRGWVRFDGNGGRCTASEITANSESQAITMPSVTAPSGGYILTGWNTEQDGSGQSFAPGATSTEVVHFGEIVTLYAQWEKGLYVNVQIFLQQADGVTYPTNGSSASNYYPVDFPSGQKLVRAHETVTVIPKDLNGTNQTYLTPQTVTFTPNSTEDYFIVSSYDNTVEFGEATATRIYVKLYYKRTQYDIVYDGNGADAGWMNQQHCIASVAHQLEGNKYSKTNAIFTGWNTAPDGSGTTYTDKASNLTYLAGNGGVFTLYAQWSDLPTVPASSDGTYTITLKGREKIELAGLPSGTSYQIIEDDVPSWWQKTSESNTSGVIVSNETAQAVITNKYVASGEIVLQAWKKLNNHTISDGDFSFQLKRSNTVLQTVTNSNPDYNEHIVNQDSGDMEDNPHYGDAPITFAPITFTNTGTWANYTIAEVGGDVPTITYDSTPINVRIQVTDAGHGNLQCVATYTNNKDTFVNTVEPGALRLEKDVEGASTDSMFTFDIDLCNQDGAALSDASYNIVRDTSYHIMPTGQTSASQFAPDSESDIIVFDANGGQFAGGYSQNVVGVKAFEGPITKVSHTENIAADGTKLYDYGRSWGNANIVGSGRPTGNSKAHVITIPGASSLTVTMQNAGYYNDYLSVWRGAHPEYLAGTNSYSTGYWKSYYYMSASSPQTWTTTGNTLTFSFSSMPSISGTGYDLYGYYATVTGTGIMAETTGGEYMEPTGASSGQVFSGWYTSPNCLDSERVDWDNYVPQGPQNDKTTVVRLYAKWTNNTSTTGSVQSVNGRVTLTLHAGESVQINDLPDGVAYTIKERTTAGWEEIAEEGTAGTIVAGQVSQATVTNRQLTADGEFSVQGTKTLLGKELEADQFEFELTDGDDEFVARTANAADGTISFVGLPLTEEQVGSTLTYHVSEIAGNDPYVTYDDHVETITVTVSSENGQIIGEVSYDNDGVSFENRYANPIDMPATGKMGLVGAAALVGVVVAALAAMEIERRRLVVGCRESDDRTA